MSIFVEIPAYRDPELIPTLRDCLEKAANPENLVFGICHQHHPDDHWDSLSEFANDPRFRVVDVSAPESLGCTWARHQCWTQFQDEDYVLQIDSHMRFIKHWDRHLIDLLSSLPDRSVISTYAPAYDLDGTRRQTPLQMGVRFRPRPHIPEHPTAPAAPGCNPAAYMAGHFIFARGEWFRAVPPNPTVYFFGEEIDFAVRTWTHGFDIYCPDMIYLWHRYGRDEDHRHWQDNNWDELNVQSFRWVTDLLLGRIKDPVYGLGTARTLAEYESFAGISFKNSEVLQPTCNAPAENG